VVFFILVCSLLLLRVIVEAGAFFFADGGHLCCKVNRCHLLFELERACGWPFAGLLLGLALVAESRYRFSLHFSSLGLLLSFARLLFLSDSLGFQLCFFLCLQPLQSLDTLELEFLCEVDSGALNELIEQIDRVLVIDLLREHLHELR